MAVKTPKSFRERWNDLDPVRKKQIMIGLAVLGVALVSWIIVSGGSTGPSTSRAAQGRIQNALMPDDGARDLGVSSMGRDVREVQNRLRQLEGENSRLKTQLSRSQETAGAGSRDQRLMEDMARLRTELADLRREQEQRAREVPAQIPAQNGAVPDGEMMPIEGVSFGGIRSVEQVEPPRPAPPPPIDAGGMAEASYRDKFYLPAGAILQGVLLSGVDAPSGKAAMKDPIPVLARIKVDAILPNRYRADIKECFALLEAVGDLASERAMMRAITMSCVRRDRSIIEVPLAGYAVGEDGRAGLRGDVVTKQGAVLGRAMIAGFADGLARAFGGGNTFSFGGNTGVSSADLERGALGGASSALDRVSQWYLERADELHPTINIDSGRQITVVLTRGRELATLRNAVANLGNSRR